MNNLERSESHASGEGQRKRLRSSNRKVTGFLTGLSRYNALTYGARFAQTSISYRCSMVGIIASSGSLIRKVTWLV